MKTAKVYTLDLLFQNLERSIAAYLVQGPDGAVLVETGPMTTLSTLLSQLEEHGLQPSDIEHILVTHIHLDHAGAAGWWAQQGATVYVHHVGAPHLIDPSRLWRSAGRIYGDAMERLWGEILPAPAERVVSIDDGDTIEVAGLRFVAHDTPGHAWHHHVFQLENVGFSGDAAGVRLVPDEWVSLPAPPPEFDLQAWQETLQKMQALDLDALYLTHFGKVEDTADHLRRLQTLLNANTAFIREQMEAGVERDELVQAYRAWNRERALNTDLSADGFGGRYEAANPLFMSVDGIMRYWRKQGV